MGEEDHLRGRGVEVVVLDSQDCKDLMQRFIAEKPEVSIPDQVPFDDHQHMFLQLWDEDIGEP